MRHWVHELLEQTVTKEQLPQPLWDSLMRLARIVEEGPDYIFRTSKAEKICDDIQDCPDIGGLARCMFDIATSFGFQHGTIFLLSSGKRNTVWTHRVCTSLPEKWLRHYQERKYQFIDPVIVRAMTSKAPSLVSRSANDSPMVKQFWDEAEMFGIGSVCLALRVELKSGAVLGLSLTSQGYSKNTIEKLALDMSDLDTLAREAAATFENFSALGAQNKYELTLDELSFLRLLLVNGDAAKAGEFRAFFSSNSALQTSIARKLGVKNVFQAIAVAVGRGMFDDLPFEESEVNSLFANLPGLQALLTGVPLDENIAMDAPTQDVSSIDANELRQR